VLAAAVLARRRDFFAGISNPRKFSWATGGAMFLGFLMATLGLKLRLENSNMLSAWVVPVLVLGATIFDTHAGHHFSQAGAGYFPSPRREKITRRIVWQILDWDSEERSWQCTFSARFAVRSRSWSVFCPFRFRSALLVFALLLALAGIAFLERAPL